MVTDFVRLNLAIGIKTIPCAVLGFGWPPPEYIFVSDGNEFVELTEVKFSELNQKDLEFVLKRTSHSQITDDQIEMMDHVVRGAEYHYVGNLSKGLSYEN